MYIMFEAITIHTGSCHQNTNLKPKYHIPLEPKAVETKDWLWPNMADHGMELSTDLMVL